ncbi:hypothetical protein F0562_030558 [Nyssa sinensis]|uniref:Uncharacterized protein n=1 Tax=Nyssa sinensis TaxID=561372 RepID=A0A5J5B047_9ASTE|nr:hypothetical protein F0562_030558 [Nyssa sinensis]
MKAVATLLYRKSDYPLYHKSDFFLCHFFRGYGFRRQESNFGLWLVPIIVSITLLEAIATLLGYRKTPQSGILWLWISITTVGNKILECMLAFGVGLLCQGSKLQSWAMDCRELQFIISNQFFTTEPCACEPSSLPKYPPSKEMDVKLAARRQRGLSGKTSVVDGARRVGVHGRAGRAMPAPEANAELQANLDICDTNFPF